MAKQNPHSGRRNTNRARRAAGATPGPSSQLSRGAAQRRAAQQPWWKRNAAIIVTIATVAALIGLFALLSRQGGSSASGVGNPVPTDVLNAMMNPDPTIFAIVGTGGLKDPLISTGASVHKGPTGKPQVFYYGAEYCPYCAAER